MKITRPYISIQMLNGRPQLSSAYLKFSHCISVYDIRPIDENIRRISRVALSLNIFQSFLEKM